MFVARPIARDDLPELLALTELTGTGLTTLPADHDRLLARIERSLASFEGAAARADECYMFVLVDTTSGRVVGTSAIEAAIGLAEPWYNYRVGTLVHASRQLGVYTSVPILFLGNDHTGHSELASLFVEQRARHARNGSLISKSRLLFIAEFAGRFSQRVIAELRGPLDSEGRSPFWEALGRHFFAIDYSAADYLTGTGQRSFIAELMPRHPVYLNLLPRDARDAVGVVHDDTRPARALLEQEGFRYEGYIDIFDAGPTLECLRDDIGALRHSRVMEIQPERRQEAAGGSGERVPWLVANRSFSEWRTIIAEAPREVERFPLSPAAMQALLIHGDASVRAVPLSPLHRQPHAQPA